MSDRKYCLIIDDSDVIREIASRIVAEIGFEPVQSDSAAAGLACCKENKPQIVLLDWDLPSMGALDFLRGAADIPPGDKPEIMLCATENDPQQFTLAKAAGAAHHILKPFDKATIESKFVEMGLLDGAAAKSSVAGQG